MTSNIFKILMILLVVLVSSLLVLSSFKEDTQTTNNDVRAENADSPLVAKISDYTQRMEDYGFSGVLLVAKDGKILIREGYGLANREQNIPITADTVFPVGSITKQFTAAAILKLEMAGKLKVEDSLYKYFDNLPDDKQAITIHQLLTHTAGLPQALGPDFEPINSENYLQLAFSELLISAPGEHYQYSNVGYSILGILIEKLSGMSYEEFLNEKLFQPAGMTNTGYLIPQWKPQSVLIGYRGDEKWGTILERPWLADGPGWHLRANGGIHSTLDDMYRWHRALESGKILPEWELQKLYTPYVAENPEGSSHYGYGWTIFTTPRGTRLVAHNGGDPAYGADFLRYLDEDVVVFVASNNSDARAYDISFPIARIIFGYDVISPPAVVSITSSRLEEFAGEYALPAGGNLEVSVVDNHLRLSAEGQDSLVLLAGLSFSNQDQAAVLNEKVQKIVESAATGDYQPLHEAFGGNLTLEEIAEIEGQMWQSWRDQFGPFSGVEVMGTTSQNDSPLVTTIAVLNFERSSVYLRYLWEMDHLVGVQPMSEFSSIKNFVPISENEFASYRFVDSELTRIRFHANDQGLIEGLVFQTPNGDVMLVKQQGQLLTD